MFSRFFTIELTNLSICFIGMLLLFNKHFDSPQHGKHSRNPRQRIRDAEASKWWKLYKNKSHLMFNETCSNNNIMIFCRPIQISSCGKGSICTVRSIGNFMTKTQYGIFYAFSFLRKLYDIGT